MSIWNGRRIASVTRWGRRGDKQDGIDLKGKWTDGRSLIGDLLPAGVLNVVNGFGAEAGKPLASSNRIGKIALTSISLTGETTTGRLNMQYAIQNRLPVTLELGGKTPNIFFNDVMSAADDYQDQALEGFTMFALNQGEVCTCP